MSKMSKYFMKKYILIYYTRVDYRNITMHKRINYKGWKSAF